MPNIVVSLLAVPQSSLFPPLSGVLDALRDPSSARLEAVADGADRIADGLSGRASGAGDGVADATASGAGDVADGSGDAAHCVADGASDELGSASDSLVLRGRHGDGFVVWVWGVFDRVGVNEGGILQCDFMAILNDLWDVERAGLE